MVEHLRSEFPVRLVQPCVQHCCRDVRVPYVPVRFYGPQSVVVLCPRCVRMHTDDSQKRAKCLIERRVTVEYTLVDVDAKLDAHLVLVVRELALARELCLILDVSLVHVLRQRVLEPQHAGVPAVLGACEPTFEVDVAGPYGDHLMRRLSWLLARLRGGLSRAEEIRRTSKSHHRHFLHRCKETPSVRHCKGDSGERVRPVLLQMRRRCHAVRRASSGMSVDAASSRPCVP